MQELTNGLRAFVDDHGMLDGEDAPDPSTSAGRMQKVAEEWAAACLRLFEGELCRKGLAISAAMSDFLGELERTDGEAKKEGR